ncbi:hypothetical protein [Acidisoma sp. S159]|uniref:hypothetical protein n=1 Tax=Acidisoma sp. S159 TaxID=1747225 RepID=UPI00131E17EE|nr:hypothetical protein [Acidisoma sp. S159]
MTEDYDDVLHEFDDPDEDLKQAELVCRVTDGKLRGYLEWMTIAYAWIHLRNQILSNADVDLEEDSDYRRIPEYQIALEQARKDYPHLMGLSASTCKHLEWFEGHSLGLFNWGEKLSNDEKARLTSPLIIRRRYEAAEKAKVLGSSTM